MKITPPGLLFFFCGGATVGAGLGVIFGGAEVTAVMGVLLLLTGLLDVFWRTR